MARNNFNKEDIEFMRELEASRHRDANKFAYTLSLMLFVFLIAFVIWSKLAVLDEVTRGEASVIPSSRIQAIQNLEGGILSEIMVKTGSIVEKGDIILRIDNSVAKSTFREEKTRYNNLRAKIVRLDAEAADKELVFPEDLIKEAPAAVDFEKTQYLINKERKSAESSVLGSRTSQRRQEVQEMKSRQTQLESQLATLKQEYGITQPLVAQGIMPQLDLIRLQGQIAETEGEIRTIKLSIPRAQNAVQEAEQQIKESKMVGRSESSKELSQMRAEVDSLREAMTAGEDRFKRTEVTSPVKGTVKEIFISTVGGVIQPGEKIMEIVPLGDTLLIEAKVKPSDIAFIRPEQEAMIKITAYDFSVYGGLKGIVEQIGADTITDEEGNSFYRVYLRTKETALVHNGKELPIIPGMTASVDILTGQKSVFDYLMKPILKAKSNALRER